MSGKNFNCSQSWVQIWAIRAHIWWTVLLHSDSYSQGSTKVKAVVVCYAMSKCIAKSGIWSSIVADSYLLCLRSCDCMAFFSSEGSHTLKLQSSLAGWRKPQSKNLFSWSNLRFIYKAAANRKELRSSLRHFYNRPAVFCVTYVVARVLAEWRRSALPFLFLRHSPETDTHLGVLTVPSGGLQSHLQVVFV